MLCSQCSEVIKPIVAVDIDGTLGDYHGHFRDFMEDYFDRRMSNSYTGSMPFKEYWLQSQPWMSAKDWHEVKLAYRQGGMKRTMPIFHGARELCQAIREADAELWLTTTRPYLSLDNVIPDTVEWLRRNEIKYDGLLFDEDKYATLAKRVDDRRVVAIFDDLREMCIAASKVSYWGSDAPVLVAGRYNSSQRWPLMCDLDAAVDIALERIKWWKETHARL